MDAPEVPPLGYVLQSPDSSWWAERMQFDYWRSLDDVAKGDLCERWNAAVHETHLAGLRELHPAASERELELRAAAARYGPELIRKLLGFDATADSR